MIFDLEEMNYSSSPEKSFHKVSKQSEKTIDSKILSQQPTNDPSNERFFFKFKQWTNENENNNLTHEDEFYRSDMSAFSETNEMPGFFSGEMSEADTRSVADSQKNSNKKRMKLDDFEGGSTYLLTPKKRTPKLNKAIKKKRKKTSQANPPGINLFPLISKKHSIRSKTVKTKKLLNEFYHLIEREKKEIVETQEPEIFTNFPGLYFPVFNQGNVSSVFESHPTEKDSSISGFSLEKDLRQGRFVSSPYNEFDLKSSEAIF